MAISEWSFDDIPICTARPVADTGGSMTGGAAQVGRLETTVSSRSATSCLASRRSVPGLKISSIDDSWGTDLERRSSSPSTPLRACSSGTVTRDSTSEVVRPMQRVWISTRGGANSGNTSIRIAGRATVPNTIMPTAAATTMNRNLRLAETVRRISVGRGGVVIPPRPPARRPGARARRR